VPAILQKKSQKKTIQKFECNCMKSPGHCADLLPPGATKTKCFANSFSKPASLVKVRACVSANAVPTRTTRLNDRALELWASVRACPCVRACGRVRVRVCVRVRLFACANNETQRGCNEIRRAAWRAKSLVALISLAARHGEPVVLAAG
jgi:hypothetical protein